MAEALYRKYRPQVFEDVVGQEPIERTLKNAIDQDKVSHAYLFCGPRGTGKTTTARLLAKALLCQKGPTSEPDGTCEDCFLIANGSHPDVYELDAASRTGVENVREEIISRVQFAPTRGRSKVYIIDEVHMLSTAAFNALLKTLEEPPSHVVFILCTTDPQKVPETIHSRCQRFDFRRIAPESMVSRLGAICMAEDVEFEGEALDLIAQRADGGLRNALTSLEQIIAFEGGKVTLEGAERLLGSIDSNDLAEIMAHVGQRDIASCFRWTADYVETGADLAQFVRDMAEHVRNLYVLALVGDDADLEVSETARRELTGELQWFGPDRASRLLGVLGDLIAELKTSSNPRLSFEIALTRMVRPDSDLTLESLAERIEALESGYSAVAHVVSSGAGALPAVEAYPLSASEGVSLGVPGSDADAALPGPGGQTDSGASLPGSMLEPAADGARVPAEPRSASGAGGAAAHGQGAGDDSQTPSAARSEAGSPQDLLSNPASLQRIWQAALADVKHVKQAYGVLFLNTKCSYDADAETVVIAFPAESTFAFNAVQKPDVQDTLARALAKAAGAEVPFRYVQGIAVEQGGPASKAVRAAAAVQTDRAAQAAQTAQVVQPVQEAPDALPQGDRERDAGQAQPALRQPEAGQSRQAAGQSAASQAQPAERQSEGSTTSHPEDDLQYEQVPYEDLMYEQVPYEEFEQSASPAPAQREEPPSATPQAAQEPLDVAAYGIEAASTPEAEAETSPSPAEAMPGQSADDIEALLRSGFGDGVVVSEVD